MPLLRNATLVAIFVFGISLIFRFDAPLNFQFSETGATFSFMQEDKIKSLYNSSSSFELFDTAPIFIPTRWNYSSTVFPEKKIISDAKFVSFTPLIKIEESINHNRIELNSDIIESGLLYEDTFFDPRLLDLFVIRSTNVEKTFSNDQILRVELLKGYNDTNFVEGTTIDLTYTLNNNIILNNLDPVVILLRNNDSLLSKPQIYESSLEEAFDNMTLEWLNQPSNLALLPKGLLKLTFFPN